MVTIGQTKCYCACHEYPNVYRTSNECPCITCNHVHAHGQMLNGFRNGWVQHDTLRTGEMPVLRIECVISL